MTADSELLGLETGLHGQQRRQGIVAVKLKTAAGGTVSRFPDHLIETAPDICVSFPILYIGVHLISNLLYC